MALTLVTPPASGPVSVADIKAHLKIDSALEDPLLLRYLQAAQGNLEGRDGWLNRCLITQTWDWSLDGFPAGASLAVPLPPLQSVISIQYTDLGGIVQTMSIYDYVVDTKSEPGWITPVYGGSWPAAAPVYNAVTVRFIAGYGNGPLSVPAPIRLALIGMVSDFYEHRTSAELFGLAGQNAGQPSWVAAMLASFQVR